MPSEAKHSGYCNPYWGDYDGTLDMNLDLHLQVCPQERHLYFSYPCPYHGGERTNERTDNLQLTFLPP